MVLMLAREAVMQRFRPHLRSHDVTEQQWRIIRVLAESPELDMLSLSARSLILPSSLSRTIPLLVGRGLVLRRSGDGDQRRIIVSLTPSGQRLFATMSAESVQVYAGIEAEVGPERLAELYRLLGDVVGVLGLQTEEAAQE